MEKNLIMFSSITYAIKARDLLRKHGIISKVIRTPSGFKKKSCGYSLAFVKDLNKAVEILKNNNIGYVGIYPDDAS